MEQMEIYQCASHATSSCDGVFGEFGFVVSTGKE